MELNCGGNSDGQGSKEVVHCHGTSPGIHRGEGDEREEYSLAKAALKESQWINIIGLGSTTVSSPASAGSSTPDAENCPPPLPNSVEAWKECCEVITAEEHGDCVQFASEIVQKLVDELQIESHVDSVRSEEPSDVVLSSNNPSLCSLDLSASEASFSTAREENDEDGYRQVVSPVESNVSTDTEFESVDKDSNNFSSSSSFSYDQCTTVIAARSSDVLAEAGHDLLCQPVSLDLDQSPNESKFDLDLTTDERGDQVAVESGVTTYTSPVECTSFEGVGSQQEVTADGPSVVLDGSTAPNRLDEASTELPEEENVSHLKQVESESALEGNDRRVDNCLPLSGFEESFIAVFSELGSCDDEFGNSFVWASEQQTAVNGVEHSISDTIAIEHFPDNAERTGFAHSSISSDQTVSVRSETFELVTPSVPRTSRSLGSDIDSESLEAGVVDSKLCLQSELSESAVSEPNVNTSVSEGSEICSDSTFLAPSDVGESVSPLEPLEGPSYELDLNSESVEPELPICSNAEHDPFDAQDTDDCVPSLLNATFPCVRSASKEPLHSVDPEDNLQNDDYRRTDVSPTVDDVFDETLKAKFCFEKQPAGPNCSGEDFPDTQIDFGSSLQSDLAQQVSSSTDNLGDATFVATSIESASDFADEFELLLKTESSHIVKELFILSQNINEFEVEIQPVTPMPTAESQPSEDVVADGENNKPTVQLGLDVNINPFESRSKLSSSPQRPTSPLDNKATEGSPKSEPVSNLSMANNASPKRRISETSDVELRSRDVHSSELSKDDVADESSDVFKTPIKVSSTSPTPDADDGATQQCLMESSMSEDSGIDVPPASRPRSSASTAVEDCSAMTQSIEGRSAVNFSEAGPDVADCKQEEFRSATEFFMDSSSLDFLEKCNNGKFAESALSRMSLYVKFDPLVGGNSSMSRRLTMWLKQQQDAANRDTKTDSGEPPGSPTKSLDTTVEFDGQRLIDLETSPQKLSTVDCPTSTSTSLSSGESMPQQQDGKKLSDEEVRQMLKIQELLFQDRQLMKDREWDDKVKAVEMEKQQLSAQVQSLRESQHQMRQIVGEYEKTISQLISDKEHDKQMMTESASQVTKERDQALEDLQSVETAFADLHRRYEKAKVAVEGFKKNEDTLKGCVNDLQTKLKRQVEKYEMLRNRAEERLESANAQIENMARANEAEVAALRAQLKKSEMMVNGLEKTLEQKVKENAELTNICDELIAQVGHKT